LFAKKISRLLGSETNLSAIVGEETALYVAAKNLDIQSFIVRVRDSFLTQTCFFLSTTVT
jgi:hypothetical protein